MANELLHYPAILSWLESQIKSNLRSLGKTYSVAGAVGELRAGLNDLMTKGCIQSKQLEGFLQAVPPLNLDLFIVIANSEGAFALVICEVKDRNSVGLTELSQLIGYCLIADAGYGVLINIDGNASLRLRNLLANEPHISLIERRKLGKISVHHLSLMRWDSSTERLLPTQLGSFNRIPELCRLIETELG